MSSFNLCLIPFLFCLQVRSAVFPHALLQLRCRLHAAVFLSVGLQDELTVRGGATHVLSVTNRFGSFLHPISDRHLLLRHDLLCRSLMHLSSPRS